MEISRRQFVVCGGALLAAPAVSHPELRGGMESAWGDLLSRSFSPEKLAAVLLPTGSWRPFPAAADRAAWEALPADARRALIAGGEGRRGAGWPPLPATLFLEYQRVGNRSDYERIRGGRRERLAALVLAECAEGDGAIPGRHRRRHLDDLRGDVLGRARPPGHAEGRHRASRRRRARRGPVRGRDVEPAGVDGLPARRTARPGVAAAAAAPPRRSRAADARPLPGAGTISGGWGSTRRDAAS